MKEKYRLQSVLDTRARAREQAARHVADCRAKAAQAEAELTKRQQAVEACRERQTKARRETLEHRMEAIGADKLLAYRTFIKDLEAQEQELLQRVEQQRAVVRSAERAVAQALDNLSEAAKEVRVIEQHREQWEKRLKHEAERREQKLNDEIAAVLHRRRQIADAD